MKKKILYIFCCFFFFTHSFTYQARADTVSVLKEILSWTVGDKLMQKCVDWLECDGYEQPSVADTVGGIVGAGNYKSRVCAVSGLLYNGGKLAGLAIGGILGLIIGSNVGEVLQCLYVWMKSGGAKKTAEKYHVCLDELSQGHPLPYTDRQIAKLLDLMNKLPTVENIVASYDKLCLRDNYGRYDFLPRGTIFDNVIIDNAPGYIYVLCASVYTACPCIYNIQHGTLEEPDYIKDENGAIVMENGELQMRNKETYQKRYAKHCRVMRFRDLYEQTNDLPNIFHFSCNDMIGYSKGKLPITAPIVQCIEGTARNIFEMPILGSAHIKTYTENTIEEYKNDYTLVNEIVTGIENVIGVDKGGKLRRTEADIAGGRVRDFTISERIKIYHSLRDLWTKENTTKTDYTFSGGRCIKNGYHKYAFTQSNVTFLDKYFDDPAHHPMMFCCEDDLQTKVDGTNAYACVGGSCPDPMKHDYSGVNLCESDAYITTDRHGDASRKGKLFADTAYFHPGLSRAFNKQDSEINDKTFKTRDIFEYYEDAKNFRDNLKEKYQTISKIYNAVDGTEFQEKNFKLEYTLFDIFRNRIKAVAGIFLVLWFFIIGWKFINGDTKLLKQEEFLKMFVKIALCWLIVFDDGVKNQLFRLVMQVANGSVMAVDGVFGTIRDKQNNLVEKACSFGNDVAYSPTVEHIAVTGADAIPNAATGLCTTYVAACDKRTATVPNLIDTDYPGLCYGVVKSGRCEYYALTCKLNNVIQPRAFHCERHLVRDGTMTEVCLQGHCDANSIDFIPVPPFSRPYKYYVRKDRTVLSTGGIRELKPKCCDSGSVGNRCDGETEPRMIYSQSLNQPVYVCPGGKKMAAGYKLGDLIANGIIEDTDDDKKPFFQLYNEQMTPASLLDKSSKVPADIEQLIVPTSVANIDMNGRATDIDFVDANQGTELYGRFQYSKYLVSKVNAANAKSNYPNIIENGFWHNYAHIGFWDKIDCKIIQYLTFSMSGNGLDNTLADAVEHMKTGDDDALVVDLLNGLLQAGKFLIMAFPFGVIAFCFSLALGVVMFMMLARATQKYCVCMFNLVLTIYLSPVVFIMYLFDATKKAMDTFLDDLKANITGAVTPFITLSLFLFVLDWLLFGDEDKYITEHMFSGDGVSSECYDGNESDAPIACLTRKLLDRFKLVAIFQMFIGRGPMVSGLTYKMMWFLLIKLLVAIVVFVIMMSICDAIESSIQGMIGADPDTKLGVGFEGNAAEAYKSGIDALAKSASIIGDIYKGAITGIANVIKSIAGGGEKKKRGIYDQEIVTNTPTGNGGEGAGGYQQGYNKGFNDGGQRGYYRGFGDGGSKGYIDGFNDAVGSRGNYVTREGVAGGLNALGNNATNMNNAFSQGGMQGGQGGEPSDIVSQLASKISQGGGTSTGSNTNDLSVSQNAGQSVDNASLSNMNGNSVGRESVGGLNALGNNATNMNNAFSQGGMQGGQGGEPSDIVSQLASKISQGGGTSTGSNTNDLSVSQNAGQSVNNASLSNTNSHSVGRGGAQSNSTGNSGAYDGQNDYLQGYNQGFSDASRVGGSGGGQSGNSQQGLTGAIKELFNGSSGKSVGRRVADVGMAAGDGVIKGANAVVEGIVNYGDFVSNNMRRFRQQQQGQMLQNEQGGGKNEGGRGDGGWNSNGSNSYGGGYGVQSGLLDATRAKAMSNYQQSRQNKGRSGVPKDSSNDGRDDKGKWSVLGGLLDLPSFSSTGAHGYNRGYMDGIVAAPSQPNFKYGTSNVSKTQNITQQTNTSKETQVTNEIVKGQDKVNVKETRVYLKGNKNGNKNNSNN